ncbi:antibiotic biosynthesis monooxygenase [Agaribacter marinus]|uniref:ABM domain-containing protein n=1 Tax=Agaribacter marinus TaxID=1431249 RepID=A0AA37WJJ7_9ALTE|nr:antibiotic biosynthesis monooxygenase [Agaribacter marinus]GLR73111.1 hypothetical protein GCM10007852_40190 [Agaribacter marinus]
MSFVAISRVKFPSELKARIHAFGLSMIPLAQRHPGFVSISFHESLESNETMMYWEWESQSHHEACMQSKDWMILMEQSGRLFATEGVEFMVDTYSKLS